MQPTPPVAYARGSGSLSLLLSLALIAAFFVAMPAAAHPSCDVTDDQAHDADCDDSKGANEEGEAQRLDDGDRVFDRHDGIFETSRNMNVRGISERSVPLSGEGSARYNSDLAFAGDLVFQGHYGGFRVIDVSAPDEPREIVDVDDCVAGSLATGGQGDVVVHGDVLVRSWDAPAPAGGADCSGVATPAGQEGVHIFDISDPSAPEAVAFVATPCGSHTASGIPDAANDRLLIYSSPSSGAAPCRGIDLIEVPLSAPQDAEYLRFVRSGDPSGPFVEVDAPSSAAGTYDAAAAAFGPDASPDAVSTDLAVAEDGTGTAEGCQSFVDFPEGATAIVVRGTCPFTDKVRNAEEAGAVAVIVINSVPGLPITMGGSADVDIPAVMISQADGGTLLDGLPATGRVAAYETPNDPDRSCHDTGIILGDVNLAACAGGDGFSVWSLDAADGGSFDEPALLYSQSIEGVTIGHSAAFTWDGEVLVYGHEPGGGGQARCQESSAEVDKTMFFFEPRTGDELGRWVVEREQSATENCTIHNYNVVPTDKGYVLVSGNYQMGIAVIDFTDPANAREIAFADPEPLSEDALITGGDWATYWYDGRIYQSDIRRGLLVWDLNDRAVAGARELGALNPQTQEISFPLSSAFGRVGGGR